MEFRYEQERGSKKLQETKEVVEYILKRNYGETLSHEELANILKYNIAEKDEFIRYKSFMAKVRNYLLQYGYVLKGVGTGFYILKPKQVSRHCYRNYIEKSSRQYNRSKYILEKTKKDELSPDRFEEIKLLMELNQELIEKTQNLITSSPYYSRKTYYDNLED